MASVYVVSSFQNKDEVRLVMALLRGAGHNIVHDWTEDVYPADDDPKKALKLIRMALECTNAVQTADFIVYVHHPAARGAWAEVGMALARQTPVYVIAPHVNVKDLPIFIHHYNVKVVESIEDVLRAEKL